MRSFTLLHGSITSSFAATSATQPSVTLLRYTMGVHPISCVTLSAAPNESKSSQTAQPLSDNSAAEARAPMFSSVAAGLLTAALTDTLERARARLRAAGARTGLGWGASPATPRTSGAAANVLTDMTVRSGKQAVAGDAAST